MVVKAVAYIRETSSKLITLARSKGLSFADCTSVGSGAIDE